MAQPRYVQLYLTHRRSSVFQGISRISESPQQSIGDHERSVRTFHLLVSQNYKSHGTGTNQKPFFLCLYPGPGPWLLLAVGDVCIYASCCFEKRFMIEARQCWCWCLVRPGRVCQEPSARGCSRGAILTNTSLRRARHRKLQHLKEGDSLGALWCLEC